MSTTLTRPLILGTAGHIDHGKTSLIRALTGIDADRLPEEQRRGMTIDLGFAFTEIDGRRIGIVDVPGHERFIRNMVAGATGIDFVMLVVAADDGVMPQTREHLEIVDLLGVPGGMVALNKCDLAEPQRLESVEAEIRAAVRGTVLEGAPIARVSAETGEGIEELKALIGRRSRELEFPGWPELFRLPIDRRFSLKGHGTVVTGSLLGGDVKAADEVELLPRGKRVRVRSAQSHGSERRGLESGRRVAVNLPNVKVRELERGMELAAPDYLRPSRRVAVEVRCLENSPMEIEARHEQRLHIGTTDCAAQFSFFVAGALEPGERRFAIVHTDRPICATHGQRFIVRSPGHGVTIGGGMALFTQPPRVRLKGEAPRWMKTLKEGDAGERLMAALELEPGLGANSRALYRETGVAPGEAERLLEAMAAEGRIRRGPGKAAGFWPGEYLEACKREIVKRVEALLAEARPRLAVTPGAVTKATAGLGGEALAQGLMEELAAEGVLRVGPHRVELVGYRPELTSEEAAAQGRLIEVYRKAGLTPEPLAPMAARAGLKERQAEPLFEHAVETGELVFVSPEMALSREAHGRVVEALAAGFGGSESMTVSQIKDLLGISRKYAVPLCEHLDRVGYTVRRGDERRAGPKLAAGAAT